MVNINLSTESVTSKKEGFPYKKGIITILIVLVLLWGIYGGIILYQKSLAGQIQSAEDAYALEYAKLTGESNKKVVDFQNRLTVAKKLSGEPSVAKETLLEMEKNIANGVYISIYNLDVAKKTLGLTCVTDNFNLAAQQISMFKKSDYFSDAMLGEAKTNKEGKIEFELELKIK